MRTAVILCGAIALGVGIPPPKDKGTVKPPPSSSPGDP